MRCATFEVIKMANQGEELPPCAQGTITTAHNLSYIAQKLLDDLDGERRSFLKSAFVAGGGAARMGRERHASLSGVGANASRPADLPLPAGDRRHGTLGLFQQAPEASA